MKETQAAAISLKINSGLPISRLAWVLGVTPETFARWQFGAEPTDSEKTHLLKVCELVGSLTAKLLSSYSVATWLVTAEIGGADQLAIHLLQSGDYQRFAEAVSRLGQRNQGRSRSRMIQFR